MLRAWLRDEIAVAIRVLDEAAVSQVREAVRELGRSLGIPVTRTEQAAAAASELGHNQHLHAGGGLMVVRPCHRGPVPGIEIVAADRGSGMADPARAFAGESHDPRRCGSLGIGVSAARRLCDELDADVRMGEGACFWLRKYAEPVARGLEVGVWGTPKLGERVSGDDSAFARSDGALLLLVADGLGHGREARTSSAGVASLVRGDPGAPLESLLLSSDTALRGQRGAAVTLARIHETTRVVSCSAVGNVICAVEARNQSSKFAAESWTIGIAGLRRKVRVHEKSMPPNGIVMLHSDGVSSRASLADHGEILLEHPLVIAQFVATTFGRPNDDVSVLVAR